MNLKRLLAVGLAGTMTLASLPLTASANNTRIAGENRYQTTAQVSSAAFDESDYAVVASGEGYADALAGSGLAAALDAPVLLTGSKNLPSEVAGELKRLGVDKIYVLGGENAVSQNVEGQLAAIANVERLSGDNRYETSAKIAEEALKVSDIDNIALASGQNFADALAAGSYLVNKDTILLLTDGKSLDPAVEQIINENQDLGKVGFGGSSQISDSLLNKLGAKRIAGSDRYETSLEIAKEATDGQPDGYVLVNGTSYPDALSAVSLLIADDDDSAIILTNGKNLDKEVADLLDDDVYIVGGPNTISRLIQAQIDYDDDDWAKYENAKGLRDDLLNKVFQRLKVDPSQVKDLEVDLDDDDGRLVYEIEFEVNGVEYEIEIDTVSGAILDLEIDGADHDFDDLDDDDDDDVDDHDDDDDDDDDDGDDD